MKLPGAILATPVLLGFGLSVAAAAATKPVDYTQRNAPYAPAPTIAAEKLPLKQAEVLQEKRVEKTTVDKKASALGDRRAPLDLTEARDKHVVEKSSVTPRDRVREPEKSTLDHRPAAHYSTADDTKRPPHVAKYQESLVTASSTNMGRFPAADIATTGKINRFVFRKNPSTTPTALGDATVTPAAGGGAITK